MEYNIPPQSADQLDQLAERFRRFAATECRGYSPMYERLCEGVAGDRDLLTLATHARSGQLVPNLLLAAVQYLLIQGEASPLRDFYSTLTSEPSTAGDPFPLFRGFCLEHAGEITALVETRLVQTNEVGRSALLMPALNHVRARAGGHPLALIEIGPSAGLNILLDRFHYDYGSGLMYGPVDSPVRVQCELVGEGQPPLKGGPPTIGFRLGIDLNPIDIRDDDEVAWLRALIWPEHRERLDLVLAAIEIARASPPELIRGDALELLPAVFRRIPPEQTLCVVHTLVLNQLSSEQQTEFTAILAAESRRRPLYEVGLLATAAGMRAAQLELGLNVRGEWRRSVLALCHAHGLTIEWKL